MHVALITNMSWLDEELDIFGYLVVGLIDEQVRVVQVVPEELAEGEISLFGERLSWRDTTNRWLRHRRLRQLAPALGQLEVDLIHALDGQLWAGAMALSEKLDVPLVLTAGCHGDVSRVRAIARQAKHTRLAFIATTAPLALAMTKLLGDQALVQVIPPGVHTVQSPRNIDLADGALGAVISGTGRFDQDYQALFADLRAIIRRFPHAQFVLDTQTDDQHELWQAARGLGLLANVSLIPRRPGHREMLLGADMLIQPQALGRSRSLTLRAMAEGMPILAKADPWLDYLRPDQTARLIDESTPQAWEKLILSMINDPAGARALGQRAREWISQHHIAAQQVERTIALYRRVTGDAYKFPGPPDRD